MDEEEGSVEERQPPLAPALWFLRKREEVSSEGEGREELKREWRQLEVGVREFSGTRVRLSIPVDTYMENSDQQKNKDQAAPGMDRRRAREDPEE